MSLTFSPANGKLRKLAEYLGVPASWLVAFDLPAGYACPGASICQAWADRKTGKLTDGKCTTHRCFWASLEAAFTASRNLHWRNFEAIRGLGFNAMAQALHDGVPEQAEITRMNSCGDMFSYRYFLAWMSTAERLHTKEFYGYTKSIHFVERFKRMQGGLPDNVSLVASVGGKFDHLIAASGLPTATIVNYPEDAAALGLPVDDNDFLAYEGKRNFALVVHGSQPKGSEAQKAVSSRRGS